MTIEDNGVRAVRREVLSDDLPATTDLHKIYKLPDFHVNYIIADFLFQGDADEPTEAEKLAKLGTMNIVTKGSGKWGTDLDVDDIYHWSLMRHYGGSPANLIGNGGGDDDYHGMRFVIDAGGYLKVNNEFAWARELEAELKIKYIADAGLDNSTIRLEFVGYDGGSPRGVLAVDNLETAFNAKGDLGKFNVNAGEKLQETFAFLTTELNLATIQDITTFGIQDVSLRPNDEESKAKILAYVNQMIDGIDDGGEAVAQQYVRKSFDLGKQGFGLPLNNKDVIAYKAGVAEATRMYLARLQPLSVI